MTRSLLLALAVSAVLASPLSAAPISYQTTVTNSNPIAYWRLGEAAGAATAVDQMSNSPLAYNGFSAADYGQSGAVVGDANTGIAFNSAKPNDTLTAANSSQLGFASGQSFSFEYWINTTASGGGNGILTKGYSTAQTTPWYLSRHNADRVDAFLRTGSGTSYTFNSSTKINDGDWHQVVGVYDAADAQLRLYVDGALQNQLAGVVPNAYGTNGSLFTLGNHNNRTLTAKLDEVAIYNVALDNLDGVGSVDTNNRIVTHYVAGQGGPSDLTFKVDFSSSVNAGGNVDGVQQGFVPFDANEAQGTTATRQLPSGLSNTGFVEVTLDGFTHFRDFSPVTGDFSDLSHLLSDHALRSASGEMTLTLDDLQDGLYRITTYHHNSSNNDPGMADIYLTDGLVSNELQFSSVLDSGLTTGNNPSMITTRMFDFWVVNGSAVNIRFNATLPSGQHFAFNGFEIERLPEPSSLVLAGMGLALAVVARRRRGRVSQQAE